MDNKKLADILIAHKKWVNDEPYECIGGHPEYAIHAGEFYFASVAEPTKKKRRIKDIVCE